MGSDILYLVEELQQFVGGGCGAIAGGIDVRRPLRRVIDDGIEAAVVTVVESDVPIIRRSAGEVDE